MNKIKANKSNITYVIVAAALFVIVGLCQYYDEFAPSFLQNFLTVLEHALLLALGVVWAVAISERVVDNKTRVRIIWAAVLIMMLIYLRFMKYNLFAFHVTVRRYIWYGYYIPQCLAPIAILWSILGIERKNGKPISKLWYLMIVPSVALIILILTNDFHQAVFTFNRGLDKFNSYYAHNVGYYVTLAWVIGVTIFDCVLLFYRCRISAVKKKMWLPLLLFTLACAASVMCFALDSKMFKVPEMLGLTFIVLFESCIQVGLIPSNNNYGKYFDSSNIGALISDPQFNVKYKSSNSIEIDKSLLQKIAENQLLTLNNLRFCAHPINGGYVFWQEDVSAIDFLTRELSAITKELAADNDLIAAENDLREQQAHIEEQNNLYDEIAHKVQPELQKIEELLSGLRDSSPNYEQNVRLACIYGAYIKRRSNLMIIGKDCPNSKIAELSFAINETIKYLSLAGVATSYICNCQEITVSHTATETIYDFIEACIEGAVPDLSALIVNLSAKKEGLLCRVTLGGATDVIDRKQFIDRQFPVKAEIDIERQDDGSDYITLLLTEAYV